MTEGFVLIDALFFIPGHSGLKCFLFLLVITVIQVLPHNFRNSCIFTVICKTFRCGLATNLVCRDGNIFRKCITSFKQIVCKSVSLCKQLIFVIDGLGFWPQ